ncbi:hypothetical protein Tco_1389009, partial [Tanacetum coccineum]
IVTTSRYVVPTGRVKVPAGRYVVPTGKDNVIVSAGRTKVIPAVLYNLNRREDLSRAGPTDTNITIASSDICYDRAQDNQDETDDLDQECDLLASLI